MSIVVLTGATGFVGSHLADHLFQKGYEVHCIVRKNSNLQWLHNKNIHCHDVGLTQTAPLQNIVEQADYIYHVAGTVRGITAQDYYNGNVIPTFHLLEAAQKYGKRLKNMVVISSLAAAGPTVANRPLTEKDTVRPISWYGESKWQQEQLCHQYMDTLPLTIIRPPAVYGPRETDIFLIFKAAQRGVILQVGLVGSQQLSLVHVRDLAEGISTAAEHRLAVGQTFFMGSMAHYTLEDMQQYIEQALGKKVVQIRVPNWTIHSAARAATYWASRTQRPSILSLDKAKELTAEAWTCSSEKATQLIGYRPQISLATGIAQTIAWYKKAGWLSVK